jgi:flagellar protein FlaG
MELDIKAVSVQQRGRFSASSLSKTSTKRKAEAAASSKKQIAAAANLGKAVREQKERETETQKSGKDIERYLRDILHFSSLFDRKLKFVVNRNSGTVIVKVIDKQTDKVIKEIPPEAMQKLHQSMKEALGLLIDEEI